MTSKITNGGIGGAVVDVERVAAALLAATDGATVDQRGRDYVGDGIIVAMPEHGAIVAPGTAWNGFDDTGATVREWVRRSAPVVTAIGATPARYFGAWNDGGRLYLDVVEAFSSAEEDRALAAGRARNQIAVWHAGRGEEIATGGTGDLS